MRDRAVRNGSRDGRSRRAYGTWRSASHTRRAWRQPSSWPSVTTDKVTDVTAVEQTTSIADRAALVAEKVAAPYADEVDNEARFPAEAMSALKDEGLLGGARSRPSSGDPEHP